MNYLYINHEIQNIISYDLHSHYSIETYREYCRRLHLKKYALEFFGFEHVKILGFPKGASFALKM